MILLALAAAAAAAAASPAPLSQAEHTERGERCAALADHEPAKAIEEAQSWKAAGGGVAAQQCLGIAQAGLGQWSAAAATFEDAAKTAQIAQNRMAVVLWMQAGNAALAGDEAVRARTAFDRALALPGLSDEMKGEVRLDRARAGVAAGDPAGARADLDEATRLVPRDPLGWLLTANLARKAGDMPRAFAAIREAARLAPGDPAVGYEAGNIAAAAGNMEDAKAAWTGAAQAAPDSDAGQAAALALKGGDDAAP
jgi:predicted Zn-dependent protease